MPWLYASLRLSKVVTLLSPNARHYETPYVKCAYELGESGPQEAIDDATFSTASTRHC